MDWNRYRHERLAVLMSEPWGDLRIPGLLDLIAHCKPRRVLEIGSFRGVSTEVFLLHCERVVAVDPWPDLTVYRHFQVRAGCYPHCRVARGLSPQALPSGNFDLVYIDGDHSYEAVMADIEATRDRTTWIGGHDYQGVDTPGVERAVTECFGHVRSFSDSSWLYKVRSW